MRTFDMNGPANSRHRYRYRHSDVEIVLRSRNMCRVAKSFASMSRCLNSSTVKQLLRAFPCETGIIIPIPLEHVRSEECSKNFTRIISSERKRKRITMVSMLKV